MAYLGRQPIIGNYQVLDALTATTTATYALTKNSVAVYPQTPANCIVSLNGVIQAPFDSYTISGSNIIFASALTGSDSIDFITVLGDVLNVGTVSDGTIGISKLSATGTPSSSTFLRGDNSWVSAGGANTPAFMVFRNTNQSIPNSTATKIQYNSEVFDTDSAYDNVTNYRFTPQVAGKYFIFASVQSADIPDFEDFQVKIYKNGSSVALSRIKHHYADNINVQVILEMNGTTDYVEGFTYQNSGGSMDIYCSTTDNTRFGGFKLVE